MLPTLTAIGISFASLHLPYADQNQINPGIHLELENYRAGLYRNSNNHNGLPLVTAYVGYSVPLTSTQIGGVPIKLGLLAALGSGYGTPVFGGLELTTPRFTVLVAPAADSRVIFGFAYRIPM